MSMDLTWPYKVVTQTNSSHHWFLLLPWLKDYMLFQISCTSSYFWFFSIIFLESLIWKCKVSPEGWFKNSRASKFSQWILQKISYPDVQNSPARCWIYFNFYSGQKVIKMRVWTIWNSQVLEPMNDSRKNSHLVYLMRDPRGTLNSR